MENRIPARITTNVDRWTSLKWPDFVACRPQIDDYVMAKKGELARVCRVTHGWNDHQNTPYLLIEVTI